MGNRRHGTTLLMALVLALGMTLALWGCGKAGDTPQPQKASQSEETTQTEETAQPQEDQADEDAPEAGAPDYHSPGEAYQLQQVVMLSRHNIRAPSSWYLSGGQMRMATPTDVHACCTRASSSSAREPCSQATSRP